MNCPENGVISDEEYEETVRTRRFLGIAFLIIGALSLTGLILATKAVIGFLF